MKGCQREKETSSTLSLAFIRNRETFTTRVWESFLKEKQGRTGEEKAVARKKGKDKSALSQLSRCYHFASQHKLHLLHK